MTMEATPVSMPQEPSTPVPARAGSSGDLWRTVVRVAWLSIGLGIALEVLLLVLAAYTGTGGATPKPFLADLVQKVSWSFIVCVGLAFGTTAGKARSGECCWAGRHEADQQTGPDGGLAGVPFVNRGE